ncbi:hypothetical protein HMPREF2811_00485 [Globicatella sp. HMSC072A10]|uniref:TMEM164-related integral membrane acyltransferase n=1 Tax=Globicatella sp. HMSC072A10 TaxID=1739315 RepID=UPI0008CEF0CF|nr:TIGR02206 family membrane protein [Globicatella sp. HMSC072A10]OFK59804.1 hypothetical protein HMPREF2811_00485 [Globicatella sp. HMSC072A10]
MTDFIKPFGPNHLLYIGIVIIVGFLLFTNIPFVRNHRDQISMMVLIISIIQQCILYGYYLLFFKFDLSESMPLHISRINSIIGILYLATKNKLVIKVLSFTGAFALLSFLYPSRVQSITHPLGVSFLVNHIITLLLPFFAMVVYDFRIQKADKQLPFILMMVYMMIVYVINPIVNGNYFYLVKRPFAFLNGMADSLYLIHCAVVTFVLFSVAEICYNRLSEYLTNRQFS